MKKTILSAFLATYCVLFLGCASQQPVVPSEPLCLSDVSEDQAMEAAQTVLLKMHFDIEKCDTDARYIRTRPLSGAQFFEIWRQDNASGVSAAEANLHSLRRIVELEFTPQNTTTCIQCRVGVLRLSIPEEPIAGSGRMAGVYTESSTYYQTLEVNRNRQTQIEWLDAGRDYDLERKILELIQKDLGRGAAQ